MRSRFLPFLAVGLLVAAAGSAQRVRVEAPIGGVVPQPAGDDESGVAVEMFENPNLDRYLRKAQAFLEQENYTRAIEVLQQVIEGRTVEAVDTAPAAPPAAEPPPALSGGASHQGGAKPGSAQARVAGDKDKGEKPDEKARSLEELDAAQSVFSQDGRLYRPVRRLCHELLARMPPLGIELYRAAYEVAADQLLQAALRESSAAALEQVANRYFLTLPAGRALATLADRLMHEGRYRAAVQVYRDLAEVYPEDNRKRLGISVVWCRFKIALCLRLAGEVAAAREAAAALAAQHPEESLRVMGQLQAMKDLPESDAFASEVVAMVAGAARADEPRWLQAATDSLIPLWQYRFKNPDPYRDPKPANNQEQIFIMGDGVSTTMMPPAGRYGAATWIAFSDRGDGSTDALWFEHFRLCSADAFTGILAQATDGLDEPPTARDDHPRVRIAVCDWGLLRPVEDEARRYVVMGHQRPTTKSVDVLKASELIAYERGGMKRVWSSSQWLDGPDGLRDVTFLAAPTVFGERLLLPAIRRGDYSLQCLERSTGRPLWRTRIHRGGSPFFKAPGSPVSVQGGIAFVVTNAGCLAAIDAFAGDLRWVRRYEREDPRRPRPKARVNRAAATPFGRMGNQFQQHDLAGFLPNEIVVADGLVVLAPSDGDVLLCLDDASGQPVWLLDGASRYAPYGKLRCIVGAAGGNLFAVSDTDLVCIGLAGGLVRWRQELPALSVAKASRGRGCVFDGQVLLPGEREILVFDVDREQPMRRLPLPSFGFGREPFGGSCNLVAKGPWLGVGYQGGIEMYSTVAALQRVAAACGDPVRRASLLHQAGDVEGAATALVDGLSQGSMPAPQRSRAAARLLALRRAQALEAARAGDLAAALRGLDAIEPFVADESARVNWHLARVEVCKQAGDLRAHEHEQIRLYGFMEGKR